jgi:four helix bundle protein
MEYRKNKNRGYKTLRVWQDAKELYLLTYKIYKNFPYELRRLTSNQIASVDSIHRNIAKGNCRCSVNEYLRFLDIALSSLGESVSSTHVYYEAGHISEEDFERWDALAFKLEIGLIRLIAKLQYKKKKGDWDDQFLAEEPTVSYGGKTVDFQFGALSCN